MTKVAKFFVDPMCAWCWAQKPTMEKILRDVDGKSEIEFSMGGMRVRGNTKKIVGEYKLYLSQVFDRVALLSGQVMNKRVLDTVGLHFDSEYPCRAVILMKKRFGVQTAIEYLHKIQTAYFIDSKNITKPSVLAELAGDGFVDDAADFHKELVSKENEKYSFEEFQYVNRQNVHGFPAIQFFDNDKMVGSIPGFASYDDVKAVVNKFLA